MITKASVRVAVASLLAAAALTAGTLAAAPAASATTFAPAGLRLDVPPPAEQIVVFDDDERAGLDRCTALELDNRTRCVVLPTAALNRLVVEVGLDVPDRAPTAAEGLSASQPGTSSDPRWR